MKRLLIIGFLALIANFSAKADYLVNVPQTLTQPNGKVLHCFASGDEFYNWLHDENGFTIIQADDGYYYYATKIKGVLTASHYKVGDTDPAKKGLTPYLKISREAYLEKRKSKFQKSEIAAKAIGNNIGVLNAVTIYIRFSDDAEFLQHDVAQQHNNFNGANYSVRNYYQSVSYNQLDIRTTHIPANNSATISSFVSPNNRNYYRPYNATTNTNGYKNDNDRSTREWALLRDAINWARINHPIHDSINIDKDGDGFADLVCFIIKGSSDGWNDLLWAHMWSLGTSYQANLKGNIKVQDFAFEPEQQTSVKTLCHETFHVLGAPDLYHYDTLYDHLNPAGRWDLMENGNGHMLGYMKMKYGKWISSSIPEITTEGTYTLVSQGKNRTSNLFKIAGKSSEYFLLEYRRKADDTYETSLPGTGLIITRINPNMNGNANYNGNTKVDEVFMLRPGGSTTTNGQITNAYLSDKTGRTIVSKGQSIEPFYSNGTVANFTIYDVVDFGDSICFRFSPSAISNPVNIIGKWQGDSIILKWTPSAITKNVVLIYDTTPISGFLGNGTTYQAGNKLSSGPTVLYTGNDSTYIHRSIILGKTYYYRLFTNVSSNYSTGLDIHFTTTLDTATKIEVIDNYLPSDSLFYTYIFQNGQGYLTGHNALKHSIFVEHFKNISTKRVNGLTFGIDILQNNSRNGAINAHVWDVGNDGMPGQEIMVEQIPYTSLKRGWNKYYFQNPPVVKSDFYIGFSISYNTPVDTISFLTTIINPQRETLSYAYATTWVPFTTYSANVALAYAPILISGGLYLTTLPQRLNLLMNGASDQTIEVFSMYSDYDVICNDDWIHISVDKEWDLITMDIDPATTERVGEIWVIAGDDTARCFVRQSTTTSVQKDEELAVELFPNPAIDGIFYLQSDGQQMQLDVFDMIGRNIWSRRTFSNGEKIDLSGQKNGMYILRIVKNGQQKTFKLIKQ